MKTVHFFNVSLLVSSKIEEKLVWKRFKGTNDVLLLCVDFK